MLCISASVSPGLRATSDRMSSASGMPESIHDPAHAMGGSRGKKFELRHYPEIDAGAARTPNSRHGFWKIGGYLVALLGAGAVHIREIVVSANYAPNNAGATPYMDILMPIVLIALLTYGKREPG